MTPRPVVIFNPRAGQKAGLTTNPLGPDELRAALDRQGVDADFWPTERPDHATELARRAADERRPLAIAAGGDGTVAEVAAGLVGTDTALGVLPLGSVMNLARMLGIPRDLDAAAAIVRSGRRVRIDAGEVTTVVGQRIFLEAAGAGISAALFAYSGQIDSGNWRSLRALLKQLLRFRPRGARVTVDGRWRVVRATMITVSNGPLLGAAFNVAPDARLDDRRLTVRVFRALGRLELLTQIWRVLTGATGRQPRILTARARTVRIEAPRPLMVHADSHPMGTTPADFRLLPGALEVVVPQEPASGVALVDTGSEPAGAAAGAASGAPRDRPVR